MLNLLKVSTRNSTFRPFLRTISGTQIISALRRRLLALIPHIDQEIVSIFLTVSTMIRVFSVPFPRCFVFDVEWALHYRMRPLFHTVYERTASFRSVFSIWDALQSDWPNCVLHYFFPRSATVAFIGRQSVTVNYFQSGRSRWSVLGVVLLLREFFSTPHS